MQNRPQTQASTFTLISEHMQYRRNTPSPSTSTNTSRAETETADEPEPEHDADGDIDMDRQLSSPCSESSRPPHPAHRTGTLASRQQVLQETRLHINANIVIPDSHVLPEEFGFTYRPCYQLIRDIRIVNGDWVLCWNDGTLHSLHFTSQLRSKITVLNGSNRYSFSPKHLLCCIGAKHPTSLAVNLSSSLAYLVYRYLCIYSVCQGHFGL